MSRKSTEQEAQMYSDQSKVPMISVDVRQNRVRIYKCTLRLLGSPEYIQLLYNSENKMIGVQGYREKPKHQWHKIRYDRLSPKNPYEISSKYLINALEKELPLQNSKRTIFIIAGELHQNQMLAIYPLHAAKVILPEEEVTDES